MLRTLSDQEVLLSGVYLRTERRQKRWDDGLNDPVLPVVRYEVELKVLPIVDHELRCEKCGVAVIYPATLIVTNSGDKLCSKCCHQDEWVARLIPDEVMKFIRESVSKSTAVVIDSDGWYELTKKRVSLAYIYGRDWKRYGFIASEYRDAIVIAFRK